MATKYRCEITDVFGMDWKTDINTDAGSGQPEIDITAKTGSGSSFGADVILRAQSFTVATDCELVSVTIPSGGETGNSNLNIRASVYESSSSLPTTKIEDSTNVFDPYATGDRVYLFNNVELIAGVYCIVFSYEDVVVHDINNNVSFDMANTNPYAGGIASQKVGAGAWGPTSSSEYDMTMTITFNTITLTELIGGASPIRFEYDSSDDLMDPIKPTKAVVSVISYTNFALTDLYTDQNMKFEVEIYYLTNLFFKGFIVPHEYTEPYEMPPYEVTVTAVDGLVYLKDILYDNSGAYYTGRKRQSEIIYDILSKIGFTEFEEYLNIYEDDMLDGVDDSPLDQAFDDVEKYEDMYCFDVLTEVLKPYNAVIKQVNGRFVIYRPLELLQATVRGRYFVSPTSKTSLTLSPDQYINRTTQVSNIYQRPGGVMMITPAIKKIYLNHDFGSKESWIKNFELKANDTGGFDNWTKDPLMKPLSFWLPSESEGAGAIARTIAPPHDSVMYQSFAPNAIDSLADKFTFELEYLFYNFSAGPINGVIIYIKVKADNNNQYLQLVDENTLSWTSSLSYITIEADVLNGSSGWSTFKRQFTGLPVEDSYTITVYGCYTPGMTTMVSAVKNIKFFASSEQINWKSIQVGLKPPKAKWSIWGYGAFGKPVPVYQTRPFSEVKNIVSQTYEIDNAINGKEISYDYMNGDVVDSGIDNVIEQFSGALGVGERTNLTRVDTITITGSHVDGEAIITCNGIEQYINFDTDLATTAATFVTNSAAAYLPEIVVTSSGDEIYFTSTISGYDFAGDTTIENNLQDLDGTVDEGTAFTENMGPTDVWHTRDGAEDAPLLEVIGEEIGVLYSRPRHFIQMALYEKLSNAISINMLGNFQDVLNLYNTRARVFVMNRGSFEVLNRFWDIDVIEIGTKEISVVSASTTADSTEVTADSTLITVDER